MTGPALAHPPLRQRRSLQDAQARIVRRRGSSALRRAVAGMVIEDQELEIGVILRQKSAHRRANDGGLIAGGDQDGDARTHDGQR